MAHSAALAIQGFDLSGLALSGVGKNTFLGTGPQRAVFLSADRIPAGSSWVVSPAASAVLSLQGGTDGAVAVQGSMTIDAGQIVKINSGGGLGVNFGGSVTVAGTAASPVVFTSLKDGDTNGDGPSTGQAGDYQTAIMDDGADFLDLENAQVKYATTGVDASTTGAVIVKKNVFQSNITALDINASVSVSDGTSTNVAIHGNWFDGNITAVTGSSIWNPLTAFGLPLCRYIPEMYAGGNSYGSGASPSPNPYFTPADWAAVALAKALGAEQFPDGWTDDIASGSSDVVTYHAEPCVDAITLKRDVYIASPFDFSHS